MRASRPKILAALMLLALGASGAACIRTQEPAPRRDTAVVAETEVDVGETAEETSVTTPDTDGDVDATEVVVACGNGVCDPGESRQSCAEDCGCGNGLCNGPETKINCPADCCGGSTCGDCACDAACGENLTNCPHDCFSCGDGIVSPGEIDCGCKLDACRCPSTGGSGCGDGCCMGSLCGETPGSCSRDCGTGCGNGVCDPGETPNTCAEDCDIGACGNGYCEATNQETPTSCPQDCAATCGNCDCEFGETYLSCPADCGLCGDGVCSNCPSLGERDHCAADCGVEHR